MKNIIICANGRIGLFLREHLDKRGYYNIINAPETDEDFLKIKKEYNKAVVIINYNEKELDYLNKILYHFKSVYKIILIISDVKIGFSYLNKGVDEIITRPVNLVKQDTNAFFNVMEMKIINLYKNYDINQREIKNKYNIPVKKIIGIGSSTGGTECVEEIIKDLPPNYPPILIVQHMPPVFTDLYSKRLNSICNMTVLEARDGDEIEVGKVLVAPGDKQMRIVKSGSKYYVSCKSEGLFGGHEPSVDVLFYSMAEVLKENAIGLILTGMGKDGAEGLLKIKEVGGLTIGQDEKSSIVYGMPKAAFDIGGVQIQGNPTKIASILMQIR